MREGWHRVALSEVMTLDITSVPLEPSAEYEMAGVLNRGRGMLRRDAQRGSGTSYAKLNCITAGQVIYSKLKAFEGAVTVVDDEVDGAHVSQEFPTFTCEPALLLPAYMRLVTQQPGFWSDMAMHSKGMGGRRERLHPRDFLALRIDLPRVTEQRRIVHLSGGLEAAHVQALDVCHAGARAREGLLRDELLRGQHDIVGLGLIANVVGGGTPATARAEFWGGTVPWITPTEVVKQDGKSITATSRTITAAGLAASGAKLLPRGSVLVTSRASVGFVALAGTPMAVNQGFAALLPKEGVLGEWLMMWCQGNRQEFRSRSGGSTFPEINKSAVREILVRLPSLEQQHRTVAVMSSVDRAVRAAGEVLVRIEQLQSALLDDLLSGRHEIPASYDDLLDAAS